MKKILFIVGSLRKNSFNSQLAAVAEEMLKGKAEVSYLDYSKLPFINQDIEFPAPAEVTRIRKCIEEADLLWVFTPEYNFSYPGHLKNLFDWMSRPLVAMDYTTPTCMAGKKVAISGAGGKAATGQCRAKLTELLTFIKAAVIEPQTGIVLPVESWQTDKLILSESDLQNLTAQVNALL